MKCVTLIILKINKHLLILLQLNIVIQKNLRDNSYNKEKQIKYQLQL